MSKETTPNFAHPSSDAVVASTSGTTRRVDSEPPIKRHKLTVTTESAIYPAPVKETTGPKNQVRNRESDKNRSNISNRNYKIHRRYIMKASKDIEPKQLEDKLKKQYKESGVRTYRKICKSIREEEGKGAEITTEKIQKKAKLQIKERMDKHNASNKRSLERKREMKATIELGSFKKICQEFCEKEGKEAITVQEVKEFLERKVEEERKRAAESDRKRKREENEPPPEKNPMALQYILSLSDEDPDRFTTIFEASGFETDSETNFQINN